MWYIESHMMPSKHATICLVTLTLLALLSGCTRAGTPRRSLAELRSALLEHDGERAVRYIDVDSIVDSMARDTFEKMEKKADNPLYAAGLLAGRQAAALAMPAVKGLLRKELKAAIASSGESGYFHDIERSSVWYLNIAVTDETAMVTPKGKSDFAFRMAKTKEGYWRIVEIIRK
jgi:hypothetical protein